MANEISREYHDITSEINFSDSPVDVNLANWALHHNHPYINMIKLLNPQNQGPDHKEVMTKVVVFIVKHLAILHVRVLICLHLAELILTLAGGIPWKDAIYMVL